MPNIDDPRGFRAFGAANETVPGEFIFDPASASVVGLGDIVTGVNGGQVNRAAAGACITSPGVVYAIRDADGVSIDRHPGTVAGSCLLLSIAPGNYFLSQGATGTNVAAADVFELVDHVDTTPDPISGVSRQELDMSTIGTAGATDIRILGKLLQDGNAYGENHTDCIVEFAESLTKSNAPI